MNVSKIRGRVAAMLAVGLLALAAIPVAASQPLSVVVTNNDIGEPAAGKAWVRVLHASPDAPDVDVKADDSDIIEDLAYGEITDYLPVDADEYNIKVCAAGTTTCVFEADLTFEEGKKYTVTASNMLAEIDFNVFEDDPDNSETGQAQVRVVHLSADTPEVDVLTQNGQSKVFENLAYEERAPSAGYAKLDDGNYNLKVCATADNDVCPLDPDVLKLDAGKAYTVFAIGSLTTTLATDPPTDTVAAPAATSSESLLPIALISLFGIAAIALMTGRRLVARRADDR